MYGPRVGGIRGHVRQLHVYWCGWRNNGGNNSNNNNNNNNNYYYYYYYYYYYSLLAYCITATKIIMMTITITLTMTMMTTTVTNINSDGNADSKTSVHFWCLSQVPLVRGSALLTHLFTNSNPLLLPYCLSSVNGIPVSYSCPEERDGELLYRWRRPQTT